MQMKGAIMLSLKQREVKAKQKRDTKQLGYVRVTRWENGKLQTPEHTCFTLMTTKKKRCTYRVHTYTQNTNTDKIKIKQY